MYSSHHKLLTALLLLSPTNQPTTQGLPPPLRSLRLLAHSLLIHRARITPLCPVDALFTRRIADASQQAAAAQLPADALRDAVLDRIDVFVARDFGRFELLCCLGREALVKRRGNKNEERRLEEGNDTFGCVARFVLAEPG